MFKSLKSPELKTVNGGGYYVPVYDRNGKIIGFIPLRPGFFPIKPIKPVI